MKSGLESVVGCRMTSGMTSATSGWAARACASSWEMIAEKPLTTLVSSTTLSASDTPASRIT